MTALYNGFVLKQMEQVYNNQHTPQQGAQIYSYLDFLQQSHLVPFPAFFPPFFLIGGLTFHMYNIWAMEKYKTNKLN